MKTLIKSSGIILLVFLFFSCATQTEKYLPVKGSAWHIDFADCNADGNKDLVYATYGGYLRAWDQQDNNLIWEVNIGSFPFDMATGDLDGDGNSEVMAVTAEGKLVAVNSRGEELWSFQSDYPLYNVETGDLTGDGKEEVACGGIDRHVYVLDSKGNLVHRTKEVERLVHRMAIGNLDDDSNEELLVVANRSIASLHEYQNGNFQKSWTRTIKVPEAYVNWENPSGNFMVYSITIDDINNDGKSEIIAGDTYFNKQAIMVMDARCEPLWITKPNETGVWEDERYQSKRRPEFYSSAFVETADVYPEHKGKEVVSVSGGIVRVHRADGQLEDMITSKLGFTDIKVREKQLYLGSTPNGDETVYNVPLSEGWQDIVRSLDRQGKIARVGKNISRIRKQILDYSPDNKTDTESYDLNINFFGVSPNQSSYQRYLERKDWFENRFPYDNLDPIVSVKLIEDTPPLAPDGEPWNEWRWEVDAINGTMSDQEIFDRARWVEEHEIPAIFYVGHSCMPFITLNTAEKVLELAPEYGMGFQTSEDEQYERIPRYFKHYFTPLANMCYNHGGKKCITMNKNLWWMSVPSLPTIFQNLFEGKSKKVLEAKTDDANNRCPEMNLLGRGGLWLSGLLNKNDVSVQADHFSFNRYFQWEYPRSGHPHLRLYVAHSSLGLTSVSARPAMIVSGDEEEYQVSRLGKESLEPFLHMLGKGLAFSPEPEQIRGYNPIGIAVHTPPEKWFKDAHNGHAPETWEPDEEMEKAVIPHNGCLWGMTQTPEHALQRVLLHKKRQFGNFIPATPYGLIAFVPAQADLDKVKGIDKWWHTNGLYAWKEGGEKLNGMEAARAMKEDFKKASERMLFRSEGDDVFMQVLQTGQATYRLILVDPGWLTPERRDITIFSRQFDHIRVKDMLSGEAVPVNNDSFECSVPAGAFKILEVKAGE
jgi:outer membrane protein assembly factor BamB